MQVHVRTTQNVFIHYPVASVGERILATLIDSIILVVYVVSMAVFFYNLNIENSLVWFFGLGMPILLYHLLFEIFMNGQSPGKRAMSIKVLRLNGTPATVGDYILRWLFYVVDVQTNGGVVAVLTIVIGEKGQRLGDLVAGTTVVKLIEQTEVSSADVFVARQDENYVTTFPQVIQLSEHDIEVIQQALEVNRELGNMQPVMAVTEKIKTLMGIQTDLPPVKFLYTVIKDFQHITSV